MLLLEPSRGFCPKSHRSSQTIFPERRRTIAMRKLILVLGCVVALVHPTAILSQVQSGAPAAQKPVNHGGKIDSKYDGFNHETVLRLQKMKVTCDGVKDNFVKDACVSIEVSLHCPGVQLNYVRNVTLQIMFENKDWVHGHPLDQRDLGVVVETEALRLGRMQLANTAGAGKVGHEARGVGGNDSVHSVQE